MSQKAYLSEKEIEERYDESLRKKYLHFWVNRLANLEVKSFSPALRTNDVKTARNYRIAGRFSPYYIF